LRTELGLGERAIFDYLNEVRVLAERLGLQFLHDKVRGTHQIEVVERLSTVEALVTHAAMRMLAHHSPGYNHAFQEALRKLAKPLPAPLKQIAQSSTEALKQRPPSFNGLNLETITEAWLKRRVVAFEYKIPGSARLTKVELEVYFIEVSRANMAVYVIGRDLLYGRAIHYRDNLKTYKLDRIDRVRILEEEYSIPEDFDPGQYLSAAWGIVTSEKPIRVRLRFAPEAAHRIREGGYPNLQVVGQLEGGYTLVEINVGTDDEGFPLELLPWIQSWGPRVEVLEPQSLRERWLEEARAVVDLYHSGKMKNLSGIEQYWAHTPRKDDPNQEWQSLKEHLDTVAKLAQGFAGQFRIAEATSLAFWAGILHDLGKYSQEFQNYLRAAYKSDKHGLPAPRGGVDHSSAGAVLGRQLYLQDGEELIPKDGLGSELAWVVAAHHAGLTDRVSLENRLSEKQNEQFVQEAIKRGISDLSTIFEGSGPQLADLEPFSREFFIRMLLSALVDADRLDTERFWSPKRFEQRQVSKHSLETLLSKVKSAQESIRQTDTIVNKARWQIYQAALEAAKLEPGFFRLTVPTGGGKTRTSLAFALEHAVIHGQRRVIYAIPFTSIIDQTADVFAELLGTENILEHHSAYEPDDTEAESRTKLASENWDMPVVVTTNVQLFESLFAHKTSKLRKIHNVAGSVLVLDEVQTLPANLLKPTLDVLRELVRHYGVTVVLCTATQPALDAALGFATLENVREIVPEPEHYFSLLKRVEYTVDLEPKSWETLAKELRQYSQVLCIVNTKRQAQELFKALNDSDAMHLSTHLYPAHRREVLAQIRKRLQENRPCQVVSTQLVEAGVDLDFPVVYRALGPLDSMVQAAGRCNREGKLEQNGQPTLGKTVIFRPEKEGLPQGTYASATRLSSNRLRKGSDLHDPMLFTEYFTELYRDLTETDAKSIQTLRREFKYPDVAERYRLIEDNTFPVLVRKRSQDIAAIDRILSQHTGFMALRKLQPYTVSVYTSKKEKLMPFIREMTELEVELWEWTGTYDEQMGIVELFDAGDSVV
jgi:CRISPR-associated helicase Cas3/CRISPR-associated endonuclease Cas3-HD